MTNYLVEYSDGDYEVLCSDDVIAQYQNPNVEVLKATDWREIVKNELPDKAIEALEDFESEFYFCDGCMEIVDLQDCRDYGVVLISPCCNETVFTRKNGRWTDDFK